MNIHGPSPALNGEEHEPLVSIGLPVFNGMPYVELAIQAALNQTYSRIELVISDNASTDRTGEICARFANQDSRVRYYRSCTNRGAAWNYNRVFELSRGQYFKWAAADDLFDPNYIESCLSGLRENPDAVLCFGRTRLIDENGTLLGDYDDRLHLDSDDPDVRFDGFWSSVGECNAVFGVIRRDVLAQTKLIQPFIGSDTCLLGELSLRGKFVQVSDTYFYRRVHPRASSADKSVEAQMNFFDPRRKTRVSMPWLRRWLEFLRACNRVPLSFRVRKRIHLRLLRSLAYSRKQVWDEAVGALRQLALY